MTTVNALSPEHDRGEGFTELSAGTFHGPTAWLRGRGGLLMLGLHSEDLGADLMQACFAVICSDPPDGVASVMVQDDRYLRRDGPRRARYFLGPCLGDPVWLSPLMKRLCGPLD